MSNDRLFRLKCMIGRGLKAGYANEATKEKLRASARKYPDLLGCFLNC